MTTISRRALVAIATLPAVVLLAFLVVQDQRQGWPFSRHLPTAIPQAKAPAAGGVAEPPPAVARQGIELSASQAQALGVEIESVKAGAISNVVRAVATVATDETRVVHVHTRVAGWVEALYVNATGQHVRAGQAVAGVFSQELYSSQSEYLSSWRRSASGPASVMLEASRTRLKFLGMSDAEIGEIERTGVVRRLVTITAPRSGVVLNRGVTEGTAVDPSTEIVTLADLSQVWVIAEVPEADAATITKGKEATLTFPALRQAPMKARVEFIYPTLTEGSRTVRVRFSVPNPGGVLRPGMFGSAEFPGVSREGFTVRRDAVVDTGESQHVFVVTPANTFEPRPIKVGAQLPDRVEVLQGLAAGDRVVTAGVFMIDSESRLRASGGSGHSTHGVKKAPGKTDEAPSVVAPAGHKEHGK